MSFRANPAPFTVISSKAHSVHCHFERSEAQSRNLIGDVFVPPTKDFSTRLRLGRNDRRQADARSKRQGDKDTVEITESAAHGRNDRERRRDRNDRKTQSKRQTPLRSLSFQASTPSLLSFRANPAPFTVISSKAHSVHCHFERSEAQSRNLIGDVFVPPTKDFSTRLRLGRNDRRQADARSKRQGDKDTVEITRTRSAE